MRLLVGRSDDPDGASAIAFATSSKKGVIVGDPLARPLLRDAHRAPRGRDGRRSSRTPRDAEVEHPGLLMVDPHDGVKMMSHRDILRLYPRMNLLLEPSRLRGCAMTRFACGKGWRWPCRRRGGRAGQGDAVVRSAKTRIRAVTSWIAHVHRRFPDVSNSHLIEVVLAQGQVRVSGKRAEEEGATRLAASGEALRVRRSGRRRSGGRRGAAQSRRPRGDPGDDAVRGPRRDRAQQALRPCGPGRLGNEAPHRRHARGARRQARRPPRSRPSARSRHLGRSAHRRVAKDRGRARRDLPLARGEENLLGAGRGRAQARRRGASRCFSPRARRWARRAGAGPGGRSSSGCGSPVTATRTRSIP